MVKHLFAILMLSVGLQNALAAPCNNLDPTKQIQVTGAMSGVYVLPCVPYEATYGASDIDCFNVSDPTLYVYVSGHSDNVTNVSLDSSGHHVNYKVSEDGPFYIEITADDATNSGYYNDNAVTCRLVEGVCTSDCTLTPISVVGTFNTGVEHMVGVPITVLATVTDEDCNNQCAAASDSFTFEASDILTTNCAVDNWTFNSQTGEMEVTFHVTACGPFELKLHVDDNAVYDDDDPVDVVLHSGTGYVRTWSPDAPSGSVDGIVARVNDVLQMNISTTFDGNHIGATWDLGDGTPVYEGFTSNVNVPADSGYIKVNFYIVDTDTYEDATGVNAMEESEVYGYSVDVYSSTGKFRDDNGGLAAHRIYNNVDVFTVDYAPYQAGPQTIYVNYDEVSSILGECERGSRDDAMKNFRIDFDVHGVLSPNNTQVFVQRDNTTNEHLGLWAAPGLFGTNPDPAADYAGLTLYQDTWNVGYDPILGAYTKSLTSTDWFRLDSFTPTYAIAAPNAQQFSTAPAERHVTLQHNDAQFEDEIASWLMTHYPAVYDGGLVLTWLTTHAIDVWLQMAGMDDPGWGVDVWDNSWFKVLFVTNKAKPILNMRTCQDPSENADPIKNEFTELSYTDSLNNVPAYLESIETYATQHPGWAATMINVGIPTLDAEQALADFWASLDSKGASEFENGLFNGSVYGYPLSGTGKHSSGVGYRVQHTWAPTLLDNQWRTDHSTVIVQQQPLSVREVLWPPQCP